VKGNQVPTFRAWAKGHVSSGAKGLIIRHFRRGLEEESSPGCWWQRQFVKEFGFRGVGQGEAFRRPQLGFDLITSPASGTERRTQHGWCARRRLRGRESTFRRLLCKEHTGACGPFYFGQTMVMGVSNWDVGRATSAGRLYSDPRSWRLESQ